MTTLSNHLRSALKIDTSEPPAWPIRAKASASCGQPRAGPASRPAGIRRSSPRSTGIMRQTVFRRHMQRAAFGCGRNSGTTTVSVGDGCQGTSPPTDSCGSSSKTPLSELARRSCSSSLFFPPVYFSLFLVHTSWSSSLHLSSASSSYSRAGLFFFELSNFLDKLITRFHATPTYACQKWSKSPLSSLPLLWSAWLWQPRSG